MLGGTYGRTVNVVVGTGNNGNDGRVAAAVARRSWRARCGSIDGRRRARRTAARRSRDRRRVRHRFPRHLGRPRRRAAHRCSPSTSRAGVDGITGAAGPAVLARRSHGRRFAALKPGLLFARAVNWRASSRSSTSASTAGRRARPPRAGRRRRRRGCRRVRRCSHKWHAAVRIVAGSRDDAGRCCARRSGCPAHRCRHGARVDARADHADRMPSEVVQPAAAGHRMGGRRARARSTGSTPLVRRAGPRPGRRHGRQRPATCGDPGTAADRDRR